MLKKLAFTTVLLSSLHLAYAASSLAHDNHHARQVAVKQVINTYNKKGSDGLEYLVHDCYRKTPASNLLKCIHLDLASGLLDNNIAHQTAVQLNLPFQELARPYFTLDLISERIGAVFDRLGYSNNHEFQTVFTRIFNDIKDIMAQQLNEHSYSNHP